LLHYLAKFEISTVYLYCKYSISNWWKIVHFNQWMNQQMNQRTNQSINESITEPMNQSIHLFQAEKPI